MSVLPAAFRCRTSCSSRTCFCRCTFSSRAIARWSPTRVAGDRMIGMVLLRPGWEHDYEGRPPVYPIGCSGVITHVERLSTAVTTSCCEGSSDSAFSRRTTRGATGARSSSRWPSGDRARRSRRSCGGCAAKLEALLAPAVAKAGADVDQRVGDGRRGSDQRARAVSGSRTARKTGAARTATACAAAPNRSSSCSR